MRSACPSLTHPSSSRARGMRRGMTLVELMIAMTLLAVVGVTLTKLLTSQLRFADTLITSRDAREVSRAAVNSLVSDIRMVDADSGILVATKDSFTVVAPYAFGIVCGDYAAGGSVIALMPYDSVSYAEGGYAGNAYIDTTTTGSQYQQEYQYQYNTTTPIKLDSSYASTNAPCKTATNTVGIFKVGAMVVQPTIPARSQFQAAFLFHLVTYSFKASLAVPGKRGLFRRVINGVRGEEELVAPFDTSATFRYYMRDGTKVTSASGANLRLIRGIELQLDALSERIVPGTSKPQTAPLTTGVFFKNRPLL